MFDWVLHTLLKRRVMKAFPLSVYFPELPISYYPAGNYLFKINNRNTRTRCGICSKLIIKIPEQRHYHTETSPLICGAGKFRLGSYWKCKKLVTTQAESSLWSLQATKFSGCKSCESGDINFLHMTSCWCLDQSILRL